MYCKSVMNSCFQGVSAACIANLLCFSLGMSAGCWLYYHPHEREASPRLFPSFDAVLCVLSL